MIWFTADTHLGHKNIIKYCNRPFEDSFKMNDAIFNSINNAVKPEDTLYILGDFCFKGGKSTDYRSRIICQDVHLILGNHDKEKDFGPDFSSVSVYKEINWCNQLIVMCHYPMRTWNKSHRGSWMLYGHVHGGLNQEDVLSNSFTLDVGVDNVRENVPFGTPWSFKDIQKLFSEKQSTNPSTECQA
jgi:calcineurin-like phosphoesterase family protein